MPSINQNAPRYPSSFEGGVAPTDVTSTLGHPDDNVAAGRTYRHDVETTAHSPYPTDGGEGVGIIGTNGSPTTQVIANLTTTLTALSTAITAFGTDVSSLSTPNQIGEFAQGKLNRILWLRDNALNMTEEINKLLGKFDVLGLYKASPGTNSNVLSDVPAFVSSLPASPYPSDLGNNYPHTS